MAGLQRENVPPATTQPFWKAPPPPLRFVAPWMQTGARAAVRSDLPLPTGPGLGVKQQVRRGAIPAGQQFTCPPRNPLRELGTFQRFPDQPTYTRPLPQQTEEEFSPSQDGPPTFGHAARTPAGPQRQDSHGRRTDSEFVPETPDSPAPALADSQVRRLASDFACEEEEETQVGDGDECHIVSVGGAGGLGLHMAAEGASLHTPRPQADLQLQFAHRAQGRCKQGWTPRELHDLVQAMKEQVEDTRRGGISKKTTTAKRKFADLEGKMAQKGWDRKEKQLKQKWGYLTDIWKQIHDWESASFRGGRATG